MTYYYHYYNIIAYLCYSVLLECSLVQWSGVLSLPIYFPVRIVLMPGFLLTLGLASGPNWLALRLLIDVWRDSGIRQERKNTSGKSLKKGNDFLFIISGRAFGVADTILIVPSSPTPSVLVL